jgi:hypothetical protein
MHDDNRRIFYAQTIPYYCANYEIMVTTTLIISIMSRQIVFIL